MNLCRPALALAVAILSFPAQADLALAESPYPNQAIKLVVPYAAGGFPDTTARIVAAHMQDKIGQSAVVENRPGGAGSVAVNALTSSPADGYTLMVTDGSTVTINPVLFKSLSYGMKDLVPVALFARAPLFLAVNADLPVHTLKEFVDYVRAHPGEVNYGSSGVGSVHHISMEALKSALGLQMTHVPYRGTGQSVPALLGGHVQVLFSAYPSLSGAIGSGDITLLATNGAKRSSMAPGVPPVGDFIPGYVFAPTIGIYARTGTPPAILNKIAAEVSEIVKEPEIVKQFAAAGIEPQGSTPEEYAAELKKEDERVARTVKAAGIKPQ